MTLFTRAVAIVVVLLVGAAGVAAAGEIIGNTYISEKDGVIEIPAPGWNIQDKESAGQAMIAQLTPKASINGFTPMISFYRMPNPGGQIKPDVMVGMMRDNLVKQGAEAGQLEPRRVAGKSIATMQFTMSKDGGRAHGLIYILSGEKALYWATFACNVKAWEQGRVAFDEVMEKVKY